MDDEEALKESVSNLRSAILLGRTDIVRSILSTAANFREEDGLFGDEEDEEEEAQLGVPKQFYYDEYDDPYDILKMMLNYVDNDAGTCLHLATKLGYADAVRALLAAGSDPTIPNNEGATPFDYCNDKTILGVYNEELLQASAKSNTPRVRKLLKAGVSVNASDGASSDNKALHWAVTYGNTDIVKLLCEHQANVNIVNKAGLTPLHDAVTRGDLDIARILLENGAATDIKAKEGPYKDQTALDIVTSEHMMQLLTSPIKKAVPVTNGNCSNTHLDKESLPSEISTGSSILPSKSSVAAFPSIISHSKLVSAMAPPANSECLDSTFLLLWPHPQQITQFKGTRFFPTSSLPVVLYRELQSDCFQEVCEIWNTLEEGFEQVGYSLELRPVGLASEQTVMATGSIECQICPNSFQTPESYRINISSVKAILTASDPPALWYAVNSLLQILRLFHGSGIPQVQINDWPDLKFRGVLWDVSTGRIPTLETIFSFIDILSSMKINQLQLYMQNTFTFAGHETIWRNTTPYSLRDIIKIDSYCKRRYIELVPHIESLSGFSQWLWFKSYKHLGEEEVEYDPHQESRTPSCLCPTSGESIALVRNLHSQSFSCFSSSRFAHVGLDKAPEFGTGKSKTAAEAKGTDEVFMSYLKSVYQSCVKHGRTLQFWANSLHGDPEQLWNLPPGVIAMEYGNTVDHDFLKFCKLLLDAGVSFFVCPGTGSWNSVCGNSEESILVMNNAVQAAVACNALGILICDWSLPDQVNPLSVSIPALLAGAGLAWNADTELMTLRSSLPDVLSRHVFMDTSGTFGRALMDLGRIHSVALEDETRGSRVTVEHRVQPVANARGGTLLWQILTFKGLSNVDAVSSESLQNIFRQIRQCHKVFIAAQLNCKQSEVILKELLLLIEILLFATRICRLLLSNRKEEDSIPSLEDLPEINKTDLANKLLALVGMYQKVYVLRNKEGGLLNATQLLRGFLQHLLPESKE